jgi:hypothetical protein
MINDADSIIENEILAEERRAALGFVQEALAEAILAGVDGDCFAQAALFSALQELIASYGEEPVAAFAERLPERIRCGEFSVLRKH